MCDLQLEIAETDPVGGTEMLLNRGLALLSVELLWLQTVDPSAETRIRWIGSYRPEGHQDR
jgi:hypothetical protein